MTETNETTPSNFIRNIVEEDIASGKYDSRVHTRFPPEPNGYLHIGHAKSIAINFGLAQDYDGKCNLRFDDTNPVKEEQEYIDAMIEDIRWLGYDWEDLLFHASDYFEQLYEWAVQLVKQGDAYVDDLSPEEIREYRGTLTEPGKNSPYRDRPVEESLDLFQRMRDGEFPEGSRVLRAKIDMSSPNLNLRDPVMYRILHAEHPRTGDEWCIYPMYDWAHGQSDSIEGITHSICTLEFEDHRPLYNWFLDRLDIYHPQQIEFARFNVSNTIMSKRKLLQLVREEVVDGWDDPRMPTIAGMRRRGFTPEAIRKFCDMTGVSKANSMADVAMLEHAIRDDLNDRAPRAFAVLEPLKLVIENYPEDKVEWFEVPNHPGDDSMGTRQVPFSREVYIEQEDFMEDPPRKFFRLAPGREVRLYGAYYVTCNDVVKDDEGNVVELRCTLDPESRGGSTPDGRRVKGTLHWVSAPHAVDAEIRLYDKLFLSDDPEAEGDFMEDLNPESLIVLNHAKLEPSLADAPEDERYQFMRQGYFTRESSEADRLVFNRIISLRDTWAKIKQRLQSQK